MTSPSIPRLPSSPLSANERDLIVEAVRVPYRSTPLSFALSHPSQSQSPSPSNPCPTSGDGHELHVYGLHEDDIASLEAINEHVLEGKKKLQGYLQQYEECSHRISMNTNIIRTTQHAFTTILDNLSSLSTVGTAGASYIDKVKALEEDIKTDISSDIALASIEKNKLEAIIRYMSTTYGILKNTPLVHTCPICITNEVDTYIEPCGHTACHACLRQSPNYCHMCRSKIRLAKSLFYS